MDPIAAEILRIGISETAKAIFNRILSKNWLGEFKKGRSIVEQLISIDVHSDYIVKHISRAMKMRTIHSSENDVMLNDIYHPLVISHDRKDYRVGDDFYYQIITSLTLLDLQDRGKARSLEKFY